MPRVALLVPCYNAANFVASFLAMARAQTRPYDEVLFYDDASTDDTVRLLEAAGAHVLRGQENRGAAFARNRLLEATKADYVHFHDVDDELNPAFLETLSPSLRPERAVFCGFRTRWPDGTIKREDRFDDLAGAQSRVAYFLAHFMHFNAAIYPRDSLLKAGGFNEKLRVSEDVNFLLRLAASDLEFYYHDAILTTWQLRSNSTYHAIGAAGADRALVASLGELCQIWPPAERSQLGPALLESAWRLQELGDFVTAQRAASLAEQCGQHRISDRGKKALLFSLLLGPARYFAHFAPRSRPTRTGSGSP